MRFILFGAFVLFLVSLPIHIFDSLVAPRLTSMEYFYAHEDQTVQGMNFVKQ